MFDRKYGQGNFETAVVEDMSQPGAFDAACEGTPPSFTTITRLLLTRETSGVSGVAHVASVMSYDADPHKVIPPVIAGAVNAASAAAKQSSIKRFVFTSSSTAISTPKPNIEFTISTDQWNDEDVEAAWKPLPYEPSRALAVYGASKTQAEQELWKFVKEEKPSFTLNTVLPNANFGEILSGQQATSTGNWVKSVYKGDFASLKDVQPQWMVDVKDTARLHVAALLHPEVENERIFAYAHPFNWNSVLACLRRIRPDKEFPEDIKDEPRDLSKLDNSRSIELLRALGRDGYTSMEDAVRDNIKGLA
ncbi:MAG: hypothetical protein Q9164_005968 [Protoblastenia rupestris]